MPIPLMVTIPVDHEALHPHITASLAQQARVVGVSDDQKRVTLAINVAVPNSETVLHTARTIKALLDMEKRFDPATLDAPDASQTDTAPMPQSSSHIHDEIIFNLRHHQRSSFYHREVKPATTPSFSRRYRLKR